ncbi:MAG: prepilin-type N-terminal cleavage/methylation domain-containing protein [Verrucomicrobiota bacterium]
MNKQHRHGRHAFSLVEMLVVISIIGVIGILSVSSLTGLGTTGRTAEAVARIQKLFEYAQQTSRTKGTHVYVAFFDQGTEPMQIVVFESLDSTDVFEAIGSGASGYRRLSLPDSRVGLSQKPITLDGFMIHDANYGHSVSVQRPSFAGSITALNREVEFRGKTTRFVTTFSGDGSLKTRDSGLAMFEFAIEMPSSVAGQTLAIFQILAPLGHIRVYRPI